MMVTPKGRLAIPWILDFTLSMVSLDSTSRVMVLPVTARYGQFHRPSSSECNTHTGLDEDLHLVSAVNVSLPSSTRADVVRKSKICAEWRPHLSSAPSLSQARR